DRPVLEPVLPPGLGLLRADLVPLARAVLELAPPPGPLALRAPGLVPREPRAVLLVLGERADRLLEAAFAPFLEGSVLLPVHPGALELELAVLEPTPIRAVVDSAARAVPLGPGDPAPSSVRPDCLGLLDLRPGELREPEVEALLVGGTEE